MLVLTIVIFILMGYCVYTLWRVERTARFFKKVLSLVDVASKRDIELGRPWEWRFDKLREVSFEKVAFSFKKLTPESFWHDTSFLDF